MVVNQLKALNATPNLVFNEIGFSPLLTPEEEVYYGRLARKGDPLGRSRIMSLTFAWLLKLPGAILIEGLRCLI